MIIETKTFNEIVASHLEKQGFTYEGAETLFNHLEALSDETGAPMEYDPIAWGAEFSEYTEYDLLDVYRYKLEHFYTAEELQEMEETGEDIEELLNLLEEETTVLKTPNGTYVVQDI